MSRRRKRGVFLGTGITRSVCIAALCVLLAGGRLAAGEAQTSVDQERIARTSRAFSQAYVSGDLEALSALYTEDALLLPPNRDVRGRQAIRAYFTPGPGRRQVAHATTSSELRVDGDTAIDVGTWTSTWQRHGEEPQTSSGRYLVVWKRGADGAWRMQYDMWHRPVKSAPGGGP